MLWCITGGEWDRVTLVTSDSTVPCIPCGMWLHAHWSVSSLPPYHHHRHRQPGHDDHHRHHHQHGHQSLNDSPSPTFYKHQHHQHLQLWQTDRQTDRHTTAICRLTRRLLYDVCSTVLLLNASLSLTTLDCQLTLLRPCDLDVHQRVTLNHVPLCNTQQHIWCHSRRAAAVPIQVHLPVDTSIDTATNVNWLTDVY